MRRKYSLSDYCHIAVYYLGCVTLVVLAVILILSAYIKIDSAISHQHINRGYVINKSYDDGHYWYSTYTFGNYSITRRNGGEAEFFIEVQNNDVREFWVVTEDEWAELSIGDYIAR